jgi:branched-chain amino acid transport system substrate-binding protein
VALMLVTAMTAGCGNKLDQDAIVNALASSAPLSAHFAGAPPDPGTATGQSTADPAPAPPAATVNEAATSAAGGQIASTGKSSDVKAARPAIAPPVGTSAITSADSPSVGSPTRSATRSTLVFGNVGSYSGLFGAVLNGNKTALAVWIARQNARGGLDGHPIKIIFGDDGADPSTGLTLMKRMVENDHVLAFVGNINGFGFDQYADYADGQGIPFIGGDGFTARWYTDPNAFPAASPVANQIVSGLRYFESVSGLTRLGMTYCVEVAQLCQYLHEQVMKSPMGKYIVDDEVISFVQPSFTSQCLRMQSKGVQLVYLLQDTASAARFGRDCATQGYRPKIMVLGLDATAEYPKVDDLKDSYLPGATVPLSETELPAVAEYHAAMNRYAPGIADSGTAGMGWMNGQILGRAGAHLPDHPVPADFKENLWKIHNDDFGGFTTPITFPKGKPAVPSNCVFVWGVKDHNFYAPIGAKAAC